MEFPRMVEMTKGKRVFVTGASGFIGTRLVDALVECGAQVCSFDARAAAGKRPGSSVTGDLRERSIVRDAVKNAAPDLVFHLAAAKDRSIAAGDFDRLIQVNLTGSLNLLSALQEGADVQSIVVVSTAEEYGGNPCPFTERMREAPVSAYSFSKMCMTRLCETFSMLHGMPLVILRPTLAYGPGQDTDMFLPSLINSLLDGTPFAMTAGEQSRDFLYVDDLVNALIRAAVTEEARGKVVNIGSGTPVRLKEIAVMVESLIGKKGLLRLGEKSYRVGEIMDYYVDNSRAKTLLGWEPATSLTDGLARTIEHFRLARGL